MMSYNELEGAKILKAERNKFWGHVLNTILVFGPAVYVA